MLHLLYIDPVKVTGHLESIGRRTGSLRGGWILVLDFGYCGLVSCVYFSYLKMESAGDGEEWFSNMYIWHLAYVNQT